MILLLRLFFRKWLTSYCKLSPLIFCLRIGIESSIVSVFLLLIIALSAGFLAGMGFIDPEMVISKTEQNVQISLFLICFVVPVIETIIFQFALIEFLRGMVGSKAQIIMSAMAFAAAHFMSGPIKGILAGVTGGFYFGFTYVFWRKKSFEKAVILTIISHSISSFISVLSIAYFHGIESIGW